MLHSSRTARTAAASTAKNGIQPRRSKEEPFSDGFCGTAAEEEVCAEESGRRDSTGGLEEEDSSSREEAGAEEGLGAEELTAGAAFGFTVPLISLNPGVISTGIHSRRTGSYTSIHACALFSLIQI